MPALAETNFRAARELLTSPTIALEASDSDAHFHIHEHLLRSISPVLLAAFSGEWKEGAMKHYKFHEDVPEEVLLCFLTWAYCREYDDGSITNTEAQSSINTTKRKQKYVYQPARPAFTSDGEQRLEHHPKNQSKLNAEVEIEKTAEMSSTAVVTAPKLHPRLLDIQVYVFADTYMIEPLKTLSRQKLISQLKDASLRSLEMDHEREAVFDVLQYAFSSNLPDEDMLLYWLGCYAGWRLDELMQFSSSFDKLLSETDGNFAKILLKFVRKSQFSPFNIKFEDIVRYPLLAAKNRSNQEYED